MPFAGFAGSDIPEASGFARVADPYTGREVVAIPAIRPDVALIHAQEADEEGNIRIAGAPFEDLLLAKASRRVIVTAERMVGRDSFTARPEQTSLPGFMVDLVVPAPRGAWPTSCSGEYGYDGGYLGGYVAAAKNEDSFWRFLAEHGVSSPARPAAGTDSRAGSER